MAKMNTNQRIEKKAPIETWQTADGSWKWNVYRKYQKPAGEAKNPYARWFCGVTSPFTYGSEELGDVYVSEIKKYARQTYEEESV